MPKKRKRGRDRRGRKERGTRARRPSRRPGGSQRIPPRGRSRGRRDR